MLLRLARTLLVPGMNHDLHGPTIAAPVSVETLTHAEEIMGGKERLAAALKTPMRQLEQWLSGNEPMPMSLFMEALDLIADGACPKQEYETHRGAMPAPLRSSVG